MFLLRRPSASTIDRFVRDSSALPLSYGPVGVLGSPGTNRVDEAVVTIGRGAEDYARARAALCAWTQFDIGWVELHPRGASIDVGTNVAVLVRHLGFWSLNACRVVYEVGDRTNGSHCGYAYGTLPTHAEAGEELFEVSMDERSGAVTYRIRATSQERALLARIGQPIARTLQERFRRDSATAMRRAVRQ